MSRPPPDPQDLLRRLPPDLHDLARQVPPQRVALALDLLERRLGGVVAVAEAVHRRHNVSAILRSADAFGVHEVHVVGRGFRPTASASRAADRWLDLRWVPRIEDSLEELGQRGFLRLVADLDPRAVPPEEVPVDRPVAVVFGSELQGVSDRARQLADGAVIVPMRGMTESLNVSVAAAIILRVLAERRRALGVDAGPDPASRRRFLERFLAAERDRRAEATARW